MFRGSRPFLSWGVSGLLVLALGYFLVEKFFLSKRSLPAIDASQIAAAAAFNPPAHSIAVAEAETMLAKVRSRVGDCMAEGYADAYAQWGDTGRALNWLESAMRDRDPYLA
jgi:hypothetical protein